MENLQKSNALLEAIADGTVFDKDNVLLWEHWLNAINKQIEENNIEFNVVQEALINENSGLNIADVTNSLPYLTLDEADVLAKETDYACYVCEDTEEINWGDAAAFF